MTASIAVVRKLYDLFAAGDVPGFLAHLHGDVVWNEAEGFVLSDRNPYVGPQAIVEGVFARVVATWSDFKAQPREIVGGPEVVTTFGRYTGVSTKTGKKLDVQFAHTWWLRDGKVARFQQMVDTAGAARSLS
jgi:ketosteroid isomerase-like protein